MIPNLLSASRIILGVAFPFVPVEWRLWVVAVAALSDAIDGLAARALRTESETGRLLDPVADKFFVLVLVGTLLSEGTLHPLWALGLAARDLIVLLGLIHTVVRRKWKVGRQMRPSWLGKCTTAAQFAVLLVLLGWGSVPIWVLIAATALSILAALDYVRIYIHLLSSQATPPADESLAV